MFVILQPPKSHYAYRPCCVRYLLYLEAIKLFFELRHNNHREPHTRNLRSHHLGCGFLVEVLIFFEVTRSQKYAQLRVEA